MNSFKTSITFFVLFSIQAYAINSTNQIFKTIKNGVPCYSQTAESSHSQRTELGKLSASLPAMTAKAIKDTNQCTQIEIIKKQIRAHNNHIKRYKNKMIQELLVTNNENSLFLTGKNINSKTLPNNKLITTQIQLAKTKLNYYSKLIQLEQTNVSRLLAQVSVLNSKR